MNKSLAAAQRPVVVYPAGGAVPRASAGGRTVTRVDHATESEHLVARRLHKSYRKARITIPVLRGVDLTIRRGQFTAVVGQSGSGKSTLLHVLATLDAPDQGEVHFEGRRIDNLAPLQRDRIRNRGLGMIFQFYHLLPELTTLENVLVPVMIGAGLWRYWRNKPSYLQRARTLLEMVGLSHRMHHRPRELSGGEMQRAAIARSLIAAPQLLLADEPTGNLDRHNGAEILRILRILNREEKLTIVMVTHDLAIAEQADCIVQLVEGQVQAA
ncbi:MAG: ABC transporter ATP-binding protein [Pirellulaceae bacterium]|jgi:lipoprotein-releasing system ATP-binding protein|nr:ABC transporter ATP-binding protein [Pirellulaceae bacterium]